jgi:serine/threonine-protein kinase
MDPSLLWECGYILRMYIAAGQGLLAAHQAGLVHRDFKPDNVLIGKDGRPRVADFGLARIDDQSAVTATLQPLSAPMPVIRRSQDAMPLLSPVTQAGVLLGTPLYMSPEQHLGDPIDSRRDQFSFCVALYEALYGQLPFAGDTVEKLAYSTVAGEVRPRPSGTQVPMPVHLALLRGLSSRPAQRFPSMRELLAALTFDPNVDLTAGPRTQRRVTVGMIAFMLVALLGMRVLLLLNVSPFRASLATAFAYFAVFVLVGFRFRRALKNPFHRGMIVYGLVFGGQVLASRVIGALLGLSYVQAVTLDLVTLAAMSCMVSALVLPSLWPVTPLSLLSALVAVAYPDHAQAISSGVVVLTSIASLLLWNRVVARRGARGSSVPPPSLSTPPPAAPA